MIATRTHGAHASGETSKQQLQQQRRNSGQRSSRPSWSNTHSLWRRPRPKTTEKSIGIVSDGRRSSTSLCRHVPLTFGAQMATVAFQRQPNTKRRKMRFPHFQLKRIKSGAPHFDFWLMAPKGHLVRGECVGFREVTLQCGLFSYVCVSFVLGNWKRKKKKEPAAFSSHFSRFHYCLPKMRVGLGWCDAYGGERNNEMINFIRFRDVPHDGRGNSFHLPGPLLFKSGTCTAAPPSIHRLSPVALSKRRNVNAVRCSPRKRRR